MAKYTITHVCGHQIEVQLFGKHEERERRIAYLESIECDDCRRAKANAAALAAKEARGLLDLSGTPKQIAWANTIRERAYRALDCLAPFSSYPYAKALVDGWKAKMDAMTEAKWWIDSRDSIPSPSSGGTSRQATVSAAREIIRMFKTLFRYDAPIYVVIDNATKHAVASPFLTKEEAEGYIDGDEDLSLLVILPTDEIYDDLKSFIQS